MSEAALNSSVAVPTYPEQLAQMHAQAQAHAQAAHAHAQLGIASPPPPVATTPPSNGSSPVATAIWTSSSSSQQQVPARRRRRPIKRGTDGISRATIRKLARRGGVMFRVGKAACQASKDALRDYLTKVIKDAVEITNYARRKTVTSEDVKWALSLHGCKVYN